MKHKVINEPEKGSVTDILKAIIEHSGIVAFIMAVMFMLILFYISIFEYDQELLGSIGFIMILSSWSLFFFWLSGIFTSLLIWFVRKVAWIAFLMSIFFGVCFGLLGLKFGELFFNWNLYFKYFIALGLLGGSLVFYYQCKLIKSLENISPNLRPS